MAWWVHHVAASSSWHVGASVGHTGALVGQVSHRWRHNAATTGLAQQSAMETEAHPVGSGRQGSTDGGVVGGHVCSRGRVHVRHLTRQMFRTASFLHRAIEWLQGSGSDSHGGKAATCTT
eukprot:CAMPEP_0206295316 /NCGR_PEP_ID=MMETSP0106_2-20121207/5104_1 /ASSEMBLY_ACC=CAM_ASM_000206 /TAXON_ID=81532 /ORGANISM="Acanthoeca-like sp., Strain 10tr" /LENGTH=119 /DNA_ID=CAMNT_0053725967 /DNA_START=300 /DNA_END=659 /DNA_ORIENTATION=+